MFGMFDVLLKNWKSMFFSAIEELTVVRSRGALFVVLASMLSGVCTSIPYVYIVVSALGGVYTVGTLALFAGLTFEVRRSLFIVMINVSNLESVLLGAAAIFRVLELRPRVSSRRPDGVRDVPQGEPHMRVVDGAAWEHLAIRGVTFVYGRGPDAALKNISIELRRGEMVVIVGENGSGKTTVAKLLCRLYDPQEGSIEVGGVDIRRIDIKEWRRNISVVMQDYARFPVSVRENVAFGAVEDSDDEAVLGAIQMVGLGSALRELPRGLNTPLTTEVDGGVDLSGGQWQRLAIARAAIRLSRARLLVLDEPTSALDPRTEHEVFAVFREMAEGRMAVVISHRLGLARLADRVVLLEGGMVAESGSHDELMALGGRYSEMFLKQASAYVGGEVGVADSG